MKGTSRFLPVLVTKKKWLELTAYILEYVANMNLKLLEMESIWVDRR